MIYLASRLAVGIKPEVVLGTVPGMYRHLVSVTSYSDKTVGASGSLEQGKEPSVTWLIW